MEFFEVNGNLKRETLLPGNSANKIFSINLSKLMSVFLSQFLYCLLKILCIDMYIYIFVHIYVPKIATGSIILSNCMSLLDKSISVLLQAKWSNITHHNIHWHAIHYFHFYQLILKKYPNWHFWFSFSSRLRDYLFEFRPFDTKNICHLYFIIHVLLVCLGENTLCICYELLFLFPENNFFLLYFDIYTSHDSF